MTTPDSEAKAKRLIVISNRLPVTLEQGEDGWRTEPSSGGLATAMHPILNARGGMWIGWAGKTESLDPAECDRLLNAGEGRHTYRSINTEGFSFEDFYEGYPNETVWPIFHYFPSHMRFHPGYWESYLEGNRRFCDAVESEYQPGDLLWIHYYHLMLLPAMLRKKFPEAKIGFFLHIPFPASELFSNLPRREEVLNGLLGADLVAFHTHRHVRHFRSALLRVLGMETGIHRMEFEGRPIYLEALPIGIATEPFTELIDGDEETARHHADIKRRYEGHRILAAVDRLDYTKGLVQRLRSFQWMLRKDPSLVSKIVLIQIAVPSREGIEPYQDLRDEVNRLVSEINGKFGTAEWTPVVHINRGITRSELTALYQAADVAWVSPLRDGMNLVAKEYCACKPDGNGVLVLSEFAGAAAELGEALLVNPYDEERTAEAVIRALDMPESERRQRMLALHGRVLRQNVFVWAERFLEALESVPPPAVIQPAALDSEIAAWADRFARAGSPILLLDYDGTLAPFAPRPEQAAPTPTVIGLLREFALDPDVLVAVVSGRSAANLEEWFGAIPKLILAGEHGAHIRVGPASEWEYLRPLSVPSVWKEQVRPVLEHFTDRTPGSFIEEKNLALVWHFRNADPEFAEWLAGELVGLLEDLLADSEVRPSRGNKIVEVRPSWANKGEFVRWLLSRHPRADFHLAVGDDRTDEDMFAQMPEDAVTLHAGSGETRARVKLRDSSAVVHVLQKLADERRSHRGAASLPVLRPSLFGPHLG